MIVKPPHQSHRETVSLRRFSRRVRESGSGRLGLTASSNGKRVGQMHDPGPAVVGAMG